MDVNQKDSESHTALFLAAKSNHLSIAKLLLQAGAKQMPSKNGLTPLLIATALNKLEMVKILIKFGGREHIDMAGSVAHQFSNLTPLLLAAAELYEEVVLYMLNG